MDHTKVLRRVEADIEAGDLALARVRLQSALDWGGGPVVLAGLVRVCRLAGDPAGAGRYGYFRDDVTPAELAAFAHRHGGRPALMLRALPESPLVLRGEPGARLRALRKAAQEAGDPSRTPSERAHPPHEVVAEILELAVPVAVGGGVVTLLVLGAISAVRIVVGWF